MTWTTCSEGIHLRGLAQLDPLVAYKNEAFTLFGDLMNLVWLDFARMIYHVQVHRPGEPPHGAAADADARAPSPASSSSTGGGRVSYSGGAGAAGRTGAGARQLPAAAARAGGGLSGGGRAGRAPRRWCSSATPTKRAGA